MAFLARTLLATGGLLLLTGRPPPVAWEQPLAETTPESERGAELWQQVKRTQVEHRPYTLAHQLFSRGEDLQLTLDAMDLRDGMVVADIGCGAGFFTTFLAQAAGPSGLVYATDIQADSIEFLDERLQQTECEGCARIVTRINPLDDLQLPAASLDAALMANLDFYAHEHMLPENILMLWSTQLALKPGGRLVVVQDMDIAVGGDERHIVTNFESAGLVLQHGQRFSENVHNVSYAWYRWSDEDQRAYSVLYVFTRP